MLYRSQTFHLLFNPVCVGLKLVAYYVQLVCEFDNLRELLSCHDKISNRCHDSEKLQSYCQRIDKTLEVVC